MVFNQQKKQIDPNKKKEVTENHVSPILIFNQIIVMNGLEACMWCVGWCDKTTKQTYKTMPYHSETSQNITKMPSNIKHMNFDGQFLVLFS